MITSNQIPGMEHLIRKYIDEAHDNGRMLFIGTTNLDAGRPVFWNIGRIAASRAPNALPLIQDVILASASIPGVFPPVMIEYEGDGKRYEEMHVDGGVTRQVFLFPAALHWHYYLRELGFTGPQKLYVILNGNLVHRRKVVKPSIFCFRIGEQASYRRLGQWEPGEPRSSHRVLREPGGEIPPGFSSVKY